VNGIVDIPEEEYHRHAALSYSGAKTLLAECPAVYKYRLAHSEHKDVFDFGHAAHMMVLGVGSPIRYIQGKTAKGEPSDGWATKYAQEQRAEAYAAGEIPLLESQRGIVEGMADAIRAEPLAAALLNPQNGTPEQNLFWTERESGVPMRCRVDWLPKPGSDPYLIVDYKSAASANPKKFAKSALDYGYHIQAATYLDAVETLGFASDPQFLFVVQEKTPPYLVSVCTLGVDELAAGYNLMRDAISIYQECTETGVWPGYSDEVALLTFPSWYFRQLESA
jgi:hypothetical protein